MIFYIAGGIAGVIGCLLLIFKLINKAFNLTTTWKEVVASVKDMADTLKEIKDMLHAGEVRMTKTEGRMDVVETEIEAVKADHTDTKQRVATLERKVFASVILFLMLPIVAHAQGGIFGPDLPLHYDWFPWMQHLDSVCQAEYPSVPLGACQAFAWGESNYDTTAIRYEPKYFSDYRVKLTLHAKKYFRLHGQYRSLATELQQRSTSYQMHQNMGENLRQAGFNRPTIGAITTEQDIRMFYWTMDSLIESYKSIHHVHHTTREVFLDATAAYNGGAKAAYPYQARGHYRRNWQYVQDKEKRMIAIAGRPDWGHF